MKVLYVITKASPFGGAQRYVRDMALGAKAAGCTVTVAHGGTGGLADILTQLGIRTIALQGLTRDVGGSDFTAFFSLIRTIRKERPNILHLNSSKAGALGALAGRLCGVPNIIYTDHGWAFNEIRPLYQRIPIWLISWMTCLFSHRIIAVSDFELSATRRLPFCGHKAVRIYNGVDLSMTFGSGEIIRAAFPKDAHITGTIGELNRNKNHIALIEQAASDPTMQVAIVGEGELRPFLEHEIAVRGLTSRVKLFGFIPAQDVLKGFDTFVLPSRKEALGYVILEARAAGLPVSVSGIGGMKEAAERPLSAFAVEKMVSDTLALYRS